MKSTRSKRSGPLLLVDLSEPSPRYLVVTRGQDRLTALAGGQIERDEETDVATQLREELSKASVACKRAAVLLTRPTIETVSGSLPPASEDELPDLVASLVTQETDDAGERVVDFLTIPAAPAEPSESSIDVLAVTCDRGMIEQTEARFKDAGFRLEAITYCAVGSIRILHEIAHPTLPVVVAISFSETRTELVVLRDDSPLFFRTIQRGSDSSPEYGSVLASELQRTFAYVGAGEENADEIDGSEDVGDGEGFFQVYLIGPKEPFRELAAMLADTLSCSVSIADIADHVEHGDEQLSQDAASYANLIGVGLAIEQDELPLDFLSPRRSPEAPSPWRRVAVWSAIAAAALFVLGYAGWTQRTDQLRAIETKKESLKKLALRANKALELQDVVDAVATWQRTDITWLDELKELSDRFPQRRESLVRRLSAQSASDGTGVVDLSVQVRSPEVVTELESAIRDHRHSVSSKRVTEVADSAELNWSFETRVVFRPLRKPSAVSDDEPAESAPKVSESSSDSGVRASADDEGSVP